MRTWPGWAPSMFGLVLALHATGLPSGVAAQEVPERCLEINAPDPACDGRLCLPGPAVITSSCTALGGLVGCTEPTGPICSALCSEERLQTGVCTPETCTIDDQCAGSALCLDNRCTEIRTCASSDVCRDGFFCYGGVCLPRNGVICNTTGDCDDGEVCGAQGQCVAHECAGDADCGRGSICTTSPTTEQRVCTACDCPDGYACAAVLRPTATSGRFLCYNTNFVRNPNLRGGGAIVRPQGQ